MSSISFSFRRFRSEIADHHANDNHVPAAEIWRTIPSQALDDGHFRQVVSFLALSLSGIAGWRKAIAGDAAAAIGIACAVDRPIERIDGSVDSRMTLLLYHALVGDKAAALVLANLLRQMPISHATRSRLATSWLTNSLSAREDVLAPSPKATRYSRRSASTTPAPPEPR